MYVLVYATHSSVSGYNSVVEGGAWETMFVRLAYIFVICLYM